MWLLANRSQTFDEGVRYSTGTGRLKKLWR
jgi:hypothetical protein